MKLGGRYGIAGSQLLELILAALVLVATVGQVSVVRAEDPPADDPDPSGGDDEPGTPPDTTPRANALVEAETSYRGAQILRGGLSLDDEQTDISIGRTVVGSEGDPAHTKIVGKFIGNTLNAEARDEEGNTILFNAEFYWFESSVPRGSDFFVAVVKAVNSPNRAEKWVLEHSANGTWDFVRPDHGPVLQLRAETDPQLSHGGFRFDWSIPKDDYGVDQVGEVTMTAAYGAGLKGEGSAQYAYAKDFGDTEYCNTYAGSMEYGCEVGAGTQVNGNMDLTYSVNTRYEIKLFTWDVYSDLSPTTMLWTMFLRNSAAETNKAYHEFFITMQTPEGDEFHIDKLELLGHYKKKKWGPVPDDRRALSVAVYDINFRRPKDALDQLETYNPDGGVGSDNAGDDPFDDEAFGYEDDSAGGGETEAPAAGCAANVVSPKGAAFPAAAFAVIGALLLSGRRRRR
jgi:hypothetical protein